MSNIRKYLADARANANENYSNMSGGFVDDSNFTGQDGFFGANGGGVSAPTSQPYPLHKVTPEKLGKYFSFQEKQPLHCSSLLLKKIEDR